MPKTQRYILSIVNNTSYAFTVSDVTYSKYDYSSPNPGELLGLAIPPGGAIQVDVEAMYYRQNVPVTYTLSSSVGSFITATMDPYQDTENGTAVARYEEPVPSFKPIVRRAVITTGLPVSYEYHGKIIHTVAQDPVDWMERVDRNTLLSDLVIPGTHDSGTYSAYLTKDWAGTQDHSIEKQLEMGVRFFDIRVHMSVSDDWGREFIIYHGPVSMSLYYEDVINAFHKFLDDHPLECIVMLCNQEWDKKDEFAKHFEQFNTDIKARLYESTSKMPTLDDAKGKIILLRRYQGGKLGFDLTDWPDDNYKIYEGLAGNGRFYVQDYFEVIANENFNVEAAIFRKQAYIMKAIQNKKSFWLINYLSLARPFSFTDPIGSWYLPAIKELSVTMNAWFASFKYMNNAGSVMMDYPGQDIIDRIISSNFSDDNYKR